MKLLLFILFTAGVCMSVSAQHAPPPHEKKKSESQETQQEEVKKKEFLVNVIKIHPFAFAYGEAAVYYEREILPYFSIEGGAGITVKNYLGIIYNLDDWFHDFGPDSYVIANETGQAGALLKVSARYYPTEGDAPFDGMYIHFSPDYKSYNATLPQPDPLTNGVPGSTLLPLHTQYADMVAGIGYQKINEDTHFYVDYTSGLGVRFRHYEMPEGGNYGSSQYSIRTVTTPVFLFTAALKVGYAF